MSTNIDINQFRKHGLEMKDKQHQTSKILPQMEPVVGGASVSESELFLLPADPPATPPLVTKDFRGNIGETERPP